MLRDNKKYEYSLYRGIRAVKTTKLTQIFHRNNDRNFGIKKMSEATRPLIGRADVNKLTVNQSNCEIIFIFRFLLLSAVQPPLSQTVFINRILL